MMETKYGSACKAVPGYDVKIIKPDQSLAKPNEMGIKDGHVMKQTNTTKYSLIACHKVVN